MFRLLGSLLVGTFYATMVAFFAGLVARLGFDVTVTTGIIIMLSTVILLAPLFVRSDLAATPDSSYNSFAHGFAVLSVLALCVAFPPVLLFVAFSESLQNWIME